MGKTEVSRLYSNGVIGRTTSTRYNGGGIGILRQTPVIKVGTELEIGTVIKILHDGVMIKKAGNEFKVSFKTVEREVQ